VIAEGLVLVGRTVWVFSTGPSNVIYLATITRMDLRQVTKFSFVAGGAGGSSGATELTSLRLATLWHSLRRQDASSACDEQEATIVERTDAIRAGTNARPKAEQTDGRSSRRGGDIGADDRRREPAASSRRGGAELEPGRAAFDS
jgi:hypothetical protein